MRRRCINQRMHRIPMTSISVRRIVYHIWTVFYIRTDGWTDGRTDGECSERRTSHPLWSWNGWRALDKVRDVTVTSEHCLRPCCRTYATSMSCVLPALKKRTTVVLGRKDEIGIRMSLIRFSFSGWKPSHQMQECIKLRHIRQSNCCIRPIQCEKTSLVKAWWRHTFHVPELVDKRR